MRSPLGRRTAAAYAESKRHIGKDLEHVGKLRFLDLQDIDQRCHAARNAKALAAGLESDLGGDLTTAQRELVKRAAFLSAILGDLESNWASGQQVDLNIYGVLSDRLARIIAKLGLRRVARDISPVPSLQAYLKQQRPPVRVTPRVARIIDEAAE